MESVQYAIDENLAPVISMSYGGCEEGVSASNRALAQQANAEGITWMNSSGDSGAAGCDWGGPSAAQYGPVVTFPADIPEITAVGGTELERIRQRRVERDEQRYLRIGNRLHPREGME